MTVELVIVSHSLNYKGVLFITTLALLIDLAYILLYIYVTGYICYLRATSTVYIVHVS